MNRYELLIRRSRNATPAIPTDYVFYAPLSSDYEDKSSYATAMSVSGTAPTYVTNDGIPCAQFSSGSYIKSTNAVSSVSTGNHSHTVSIWHKGTATSISGNPMFASLGYTGTSYQCMHFRWAPGMKTSGSNWAVELPSEYICDNEWHNHVMRYNSDTGRYDYYVDGNLVSGTTGQMNLQNIYVVINAAYPSSGFTMPFTAYEAGFRIYDRAVTDEELALLAGEFTPIRTVAMNDQSKTFNNTFSSTYQISATPSGCTFTTTDTLPEGMTMSSSGYVTYDGTVYQQAASSTIQVTASKTGYVPATANITLAIAIPSVVFNNSTTTFVSETSKSVSLNASPSGCTFTTSDTLPEGVTLSSEGVLSFDGSVISSESTSTISVTASKTGFNSRTAVITIKKITEITIPDDYIFYAPMEDDYNDHSTYARTLSAVSGSPTMTASEGIACVSIPSGCYIQTADLAGLTTGNHSRTISIWQKTSSTAFTKDWLGVFGVGKSGDTTSRQFDIGISKYIGKIFYGGIYGYDAYATSVADGSWHCLTLTYDYSTSLYTMYVDGVNEATLTNSSGNLTSGMRAVIANQPTGTTAVMDVAAYYAGAYIYDRCLTSEEVLALANEFSPTQE